MEQWPVAYQLPISSKRSLVGLPSYRSLRCLEQRPAAWSRQRWTSCLSWDWAVRHRVVEEGWGEYGFLWDPRPHLTGRRVVLLVKARGLPVAEVLHKPPHHFLSESGAVDLLDEDAVRNGVERLWDVYLYGYGSARWLALVEARDHPSRNEEQGRGGGVPRFEAVQEGEYAQRLRDGREEEPPQYLHCLSEQGDGVVGLRRSESRATLLSRHPCLQIRIMTEFFQIAGISTQATERLKSSIRKARPCSLRWRR